MINSIKTGLNIVANIANLPSRGLSAIYNLIAKIRNVAEEKIAHQGAAYAQARQTNAFNLPSDLFFEAYSGDEKN